MPYTNSIIWRKVETHFVVLLPMAVPWHSYCVRQVFFFSVRGYEIKTTRAFKATIERGRVSAMGERGRLTVCALSKQALNWNYRFLQQESSLSQSISLSLSLSLQLAFSVSSRRRQMTVEQIEIVRHLGENEWASFKNNSWKTARHK